jgi:hypothetical protein
VGSAKEIGERRPAKDIQDVYKKPYTFLLRFPRNLASATASGVNDALMKKTD